MQGFTWEQAREKAIALSDSTGQSVHVVQSGEDYLVVPAGEVSINGEMPGQIVFTARPKEVGAKAV